MLTWGFSGAAWLMLAVFPVVIFYFLRLRFRRQKISSIYLWSRLKKPTEGSSKIQRRSVLLLLLQLLIVLLAAAALAQPVWLHTRPGKPGVMILMDISASMAAKNNGKTRWDQAVDWVDKHIKRLPADQEVVVFLCAAGARPLKPVGGIERYLLIRQLRATRPQGVGFDERRVRNHLQAWLTSQDNPWETWLVTDGGLDMGGQELRQLFGSSLHVRTVGSSIGNIGVYGLRIVSGGQAEFSLHNSGFEPRRISVRLEKNDQMITERMITAAVGFTNQTLKWPGEDMDDGLYRVSIINAEDGFILDDQTYFALNSQRKIGVLLVGPPDPFLKAVLRIHGLDVREIAEWPEAEPPLKAVDLVIANNRPVPSHIKANLLMFGVVPDDAPLNVKGLVQGHLSAQQVNHPLLRFVDWDNISITKGRSFQGTEKVLPLAAVNGQSALVTWEDEGWIRVACGFNIADSNLGLSGAFPIFLHNLLQQCVPQFNNPYADTLTTGSPALRTVSSEWKLTGEREVHVERRGNKVWVEALSPGGYPWREGDRHGVLAANLPVSELDLAVRQTHTSRSGDYRLEIGTPKRRSLMEWFLGLMVLCLVLEWIVWRGWNLTRGKGEAV